MLSGSLLASVWDLKEVQGARRVGTQPRTLICHLKIMASGRPMYRFAFASPEGAQKMVSWLASNMTSPAGLQEPSHVPLQA